MNHEKLDSAKYLETTEEDRKYERRVERLRRQQHFVGGTSELKRLLKLIAISIACLWGYSHFQDSIRDAIFSGLRAKKTLESMAGELNQEKKIWETVDN